LITCLSRGFVTGIFQGEPNSKRMQISLKLL
jgi:hypothetical protein